MASQINSAVAIGPRTVRITFNAATNADGSALVPAHYAITPSGTGPYYTPTVLSLVDTATPPTSTPTVIDATLDQEPTPGTLYTLTATGVTSVTVDGTHNVALFYGLAPAAPATREWSLIDFIPSVNIAEDSTGDLQHFVACLQEVANLLWADIDNWGSIFDLNQCAPQYLDLLLEQLGNPVALPDLTVAEKRKLCSLLVDIFKIKGSIPGLQAAIKFFVGLPSQVSNFYGMGFVLGDGSSLSYGYPGAGTVSSVFDPGTWILGAGDRWALTIKCGTPGGVALSALSPDPTSRIVEIVNKTKPSVAHVVQLNASWNAPARADIKDNGSGSVIITCAAVSGATSYQVFLRGQTGVSEWNGGTGLALTGTGPATKTYTPGTTLYWVACVNATVPGLLSNEITNGLTTPVVTATAQPRNIHLTWPTVANATSYRIYKSTTAKVRPSAADNASNPIRMTPSIVAGVTPSYDDQLVSGTTAYYIVVPLIGDSEGFYSAEVHTTAL